MTEYKKVIAQNKKAIFNYFIEEILEAGIVLKGSEVQSLRQGKASIDESYASDNGHEVFLYNCHITEYEKANRFNHSTRRPRKLLLHTKEIKKIIGKIRIKGYTLVALSMYFNKNNKVKVELGIAKGKKLYDKRATIKEKDWKKDQSRLIRQK
ncbi:SsrA-binding protein SmpB [Rickettsia typhi]|uniref:SsrA-binding protein n=2 Tax=Rickettsia typhi TaxID=785 RepID=SSRP_RICTY|nr:SsrA-binding protein SmpB [Rickettsia typhi]Q9AKE3.1 RecName: Full=SsrA-binding protein; AltName: Full=Small protein B [Rickettsia typhi str. Wilmington]AAU03893.1 tmRNA-binding protein SmpB [Rickettsia typhi str. Wilmington]AFE54275.1 SsrA-binding protein [Rickettsia typhi str. TH1527]AFE55115.1 SsrA-binding protein [Rickettsia typhi str. B9991CWPP]CAC33723.1 Small protein [Rickettsia typhi] [Rickettsia typhi str. Wilmington]